jgi:hypothetical protein
LRGQNIRVSASRCAGRKDLIRSQISYRADQDLRGRHAKKNKNVRN